MTIRVTITKAGVTDEYGRAMVIGTTYSVSDSFGVALIQQGRASDTDSSLVSPGVNQGDAAEIQYVNAAAIAAPTAQMLAATSTQFALDVPPYTRNWSTGTTLASVLTGIPSLPTSATEESATATVNMLQTAMIAGGYLTMTTPGTNYINNTLHFNNDTTIYLGPGVTLRSFGTTRFSMFGNGNASYPSTGMQGVSILCASDGTTVGTGNLRQLTGPARLAYTAPGDTEGATVDVSALTSGAARVELSSANGKKLYVAVVTASLLGAGSVSVRIVGTRGALPVTWSRTSNVTTVTEAGHARLPGHAVVSFGTNFAANIYVETSIPGTSWTFTDSRSNSSGSGEVLGKYNVNITGPGTIDYGMALGTSPRSLGNDRNTIQFLGLSNWSVVGPMIYDGSKYGVSGQACSVYDINVRGYADNASSSTAIVQMNGKCRRGNIKVSGKSTDTTVAFVAGDYPVQTLIFPNDEGGCSFDDHEVRFSDSVDSAFEIVRLVGAASTPIRNTRIYGANHNIKSGSTKIVSVFNDTSVYLGTETLVEGLLIDGIIPSKQGTTQCNIVDLKAAGTTKSSGVVIQNCELGYPIEAIGQGAIVISGGNWADITVRNMYQRAATWQGNVVITTGTCTIDNLSIKESHIRIDNALKTNTWTSSFYLGNAAGATVQKILIDDCSLTEVSSAGTKSDLFKIQNGVHKVIEVRSCRAKDCLSVGYYLASDATCKINIHDIVADGTAASIFGMRLDTSPAEVIVGGWQTIGTLVDVVRVSYTTGASVRMRSMGGMPSTPSSGFHVNVTSAPANAPDVNGYDLVCDTTKILGAAATIGNLVKSSATSKVVMWDGAAWTAIA